MNQYPKLVIASACCLGLMLTACKGKHEAPQQTASAPAVASAQVQESAPELPIAPPVAAPFDINSIPVSNVVLPQFPYLGWPQTLPETKRNSTKSEFDRVYLTVGNRLQAIEGRTDLRYFFHEDARLSRIAVERNYEAALKALGAVKVSAAHFNDDNFIKQDPQDKDPKAGKLTLEGDSSRNESYLIRTAEKKIWISVTIEDGYTRMAIVEEQPMKQTVGLSAP